jgi:hypothetical protein
MRRLMPLIWSMTLRALFWLSQKPGAATRSSSSSSCRVWAGTSKIPPEFAQAAFEGGGVVGLEVGENGFVAIVHGWV